MKPKFLLILLMGIGLLLNTCSKDGDVEITYEEAIQHEALSPEQVDYYDNQESKEFDLDEILLPSGLTVEEFMQYIDQEYKNKGNNNSTLAKKDPVELKNEILSQILTNASYFTDRSNFQINAEGDKKPAQEGLAYSFGQRDYAHRLPPPEGECKDWEVYGLDCSGLIYNCFLRDLGIDLMEDGWTRAERQRQSDFLEKAIKAKYPDFDELRVDDLGMKATSEFESGDIIYWMKLYEDKVKKTSQMKAWHIGIIIKHEYTGELWVAQSNGSDGESGDCETNWTTKRGPNIFRLNKCTGPSPNFGDNYGIIRIGVNTPDPPDYNRISVMVKVLAHYQGYMGDQDNIEIRVYDSYPGGFKKDNLFEAKGTFTKEMFGTHNISGTIQAQFNATYDRIEWLKWSETHAKSAYSEVMPATTEKQSGMLVKVPKSAYPKVFEVKGGTSGSDPCEHITKLIHTLSGKYNSYLKSWECTYKSHVFVALDKK